MRLTRERSPHQAGPFTAGLMAALLTALLVLLGQAPGARAGSCPNELFRTGPGASLPDCRAYEMVSPPGKNGGEIDGGPTLESEEAPQQAALDGEAITYGSQTPFTETNPLSGLLTTQYLSRRGPDGWSTQAITPEQDLPGNAFDKLQHSAEYTTYLGFSEDLLHGFLFAYEPALAPGAPAGYFSPYERNDLTGAYQLLSTATPPVQKPGAADAHRGFWVEYAGVSADGAHVAFAANDALTAGAPPGESGNNLKRDLYEWNDGRLELVSVLPDGQPTYGVFGSALAMSQGGVSEDYERVLSPDGSRAIWSTTELEGPPQLYLHELTLSGPRSVQVSATQRTDCADHSPCTGAPEPDPAGPQPAYYAGASVGDSEVYFTSCEKLTNDSTARPQLGSGSCASTVYKIEEGEDLYRYDASTGRLTDLTVDPHAGGPASVLGVLGVSEDGSYVYFVARGALVPGAVEGDDNVYLWHDGGIRLIASAEAQSYGLGVSNIQHLRSAGIVRVSPDGRYLAFESSVPLTGYDNTPLQAGECRNIAILKGEPEPNLDPAQRCIEVYEYDADSGQLTCASCNQRGLPPVGNSVVPIPLHALTNPAGWQSSTVQQRYLLDDGRLFFDSTDELLAQASNAGKLNVYEYEPTGIGSCAREGGCIALISSGASSENSYFVDAGANGNDVFFITRQPLAAQDGDEALDVYDARIDGGITAATPPPCGGEACRPPITPAPAIYGAPSSATFVGAGNPPQPATKPATSKRQKPKSKRRHNARRHNAKRKRANVHKAKRAARALARAQKSKQRGHR